MSKQVQWFPGHMSKTIRELKEFKKANLFFLLLDSRAPDSTFINTFEEITTDKEIVIIFTKTDLVEKDELKKWKNYYLKKFKFVIDVSLKDIKRTKSKIENILLKIYIKSKLPKIIVLGVPNVGKSTLINILLKSKSTRIENRPGVTKKNEWYNFNQKYWVLDTPGILQPKFFNENQGINLSIIGSIKLDILPLDKIVLKLIEMLIELKKVDSKNPNEFFDNFFSKSKMSIDNFNRMLIHDFQKLKFGKIILDKLPFGENNV